MRKTEDVRVTEEGRDKGKMFRVKEMPAIMAEDWAVRAVLALAHGRSDIPTREQIKTMGWAVIATVGLEALQDLRYEDTKPLLDEMIECVQLVPDPKNPTFTRPLILHSQDWDGDDIEELSTLMLLRRKVFEVHAAPFGVGAT